MNSLPEDETKKITTKGIWESIKSQGLSYTIVGLAHRIDVLIDKINELQKDNQDMRELISRIRNSNLNDQAYIEIQKLIVENREIIKPNDEDIWNIHRRIDQLQMQLIELQRSSINDN